MKKNRSLEANLQAAKNAIQEMIQQWHHWKNARHSKEKTQAIAAYAAAFTNCRVFIENYLKHLYPNENQLPKKIAQDLHKFIHEFDTIEKINDKKLQQALQDIDDISRHAA